VYLILVTQGCRSDKGLSDPIISRLLGKRCAVRVLDLIPADYEKSYLVMDDYLKMHEKPDLVLITGDRVEQCAAATSAFLNNVKIAHYGAGITNTIATYDDILRHTITLMSDIQLCENVAAQWVVWDVMKAVGLTPNSYNTGTTHLDDIIIDESKVPTVKPHWIDGDGYTRRYDLILYNTPTKCDYSADIAAIRELIGDSYSVLVGGNPDGNAETELCEWVDEWHENLPRPQFLGLLKNCTRLITNSSVAYYEAPHFLQPDQIILIGERNKNRAKVEVAPGGSDKIVEVILDYAETHTLLHS